jgi:hypothetical protein
MAEPGASVTQPGQRRFVDSGGGISARAPPSCFRSYVPALFCQAAERPFVNVLTSLSNKGIVLALVAMAQTLVV